MVHPRLWKGNSLTGSWVVTIKLDGVRMLRDIEGSPISRSGKPLYNLEAIDINITDAEVYDSTWETSMSLCRSKVNGSLVDSSKVYTLDPLDPRLSIGEVNNPSVEYITELMEEVIGKGYEGLVLRQGTTWLKVKPKETYDVPVIGIVAGKGRNEGLVGSFITPMGNVGTGLTDLLRKELLTMPMNTIIEVECMQLTPNGKFRHPRFIRIREDK